MLKITCVIHSLSFGGMERVMSILANNFSERENTIVSILLVGKERKISFDLDAKIVVYKPDFEFNNDTRILSTVKTIKFIRSTIIKLEPDVILSFGEYWNNLVLLSLLGLKHPIFISDRSQPNKNIGKFQNVLRNFLYPKATGYIAQTIKASEIAIKNKWNSNITVIGNPIGKVLNQGSDKRENIILTVGRLITTKHIDELIDIFRISNNIEWKLVIVGGNAKKLNLLEEYRKLVQELGLQNQIQLIGTSTNVKEYYSKAKIFAFTSSSEGFPNVIGEAMSFGLPIIAYDCTAGPSDLIQDGESGFLIEERDHKAYVEKLNRLIEEPELRNKLGEKSLEKIKDFDAESIGEKFFAFITKN
tara:strand:+ start:1470 stop:2549 length:1080 start_codon:yes stop_codon:yes gene_type:complete